MPQLSFVIPAYNEEALVGQCIESVLKEIARSGVDTEVVVVNNASVDRTGEIVPQSGSEQSISIMKKLTGG